MQPGSGRLVSNNELFSTIDAKLLTIIYHFSYLYHLWILKWLYGKEVSYWSARSESTSKCSETVCKSHCEKHTRRTQGNVRIFRRFLSRVKLTSHCFFFRFDAYNRRWAHMLDFFFQISDWKINDINPIFLGLNIICRSPKQL